MMARFAALFGLMILFALPVPAQQETVFIQIQARSSLSGAQSSVRDFAQRFDNVNGFSLGGGWYGVALGPFDRPTAEDTLRALRRQGLIPPDSYIEEAEAYRQQFWPVGAQINQTVQAEPQQPAQAGRAQQTGDAQGTETAAAAVPPAPQPEPDETPREARASERDLNRAEREALQIALQWAGYYRAGIDGAFGRGTRRAMAEWQEANGYDVTGVLTTRQRAELLRQYNAILDGMGLERVSDPRTGIAMELPLGVVSFDRFEAPFALYAPNGDLDVQVLLISQPGDRNTLNGLYEIMQTLEIVPLEGEREKRPESFVLTGANDSIVSHTEVSLRGGALKGFTLIWPAGDEERRSRVLARMQQSFTRIDGVLDPAEVSDDGQAVDLVSGLKVRTPRMSGSGFFIDSVGRVLTSAAAVQSCTRVTLNGLHEAKVVASDDALGVAVLRPAERLAPLGVAAFSAAEPRLQTEVAVAGYSFGGRLTAPTLTFGTMQEGQGLDGEPDVKRLALSVLPGDAGGPVFDSGGAVVGMLLPRDTDGSRRLPEDVNFAAKADRILDFLNAQGITAVAGDSSGTMAPEDLTALAADMTVLVGCWD